MAIIKKELIDENKVKCIVKSSNILETLYNAETKDLSITFKNGRQYRYSGVLKEIYSGFESAESKGKYFNQYIKQLPTVRLDNVDVTELLKLVGN